MSEEATAAAEAQAGEVMTKESLFPEGLPDSVERARNFRDHRREAAKVELPELADGEGETDNLAEAQETDEQDQEAEEAQEAALGRMRLKDFLNAAGVSMEEFYRDVVVERDGAEVPVSAAWDDYKSLQEANDALLRERVELQEKVNRSATQMQQPGISQEAQMLANRAQIKLQQIAETDWSQIDPGQAANLKIDLRAQADQLWAQAQQKQAEHHEKQQQEVRKVLEEADRQVRAAIPEWNDSAVRAADWRAIGDMLSGYGIGQQEIDSVIDPRWRRFFRDALQSKAQTARITQGAKKIRKVGKTLSPGSRAPISKTPTLRGARAQLKAARDQGATKSELHRARLQVELPDIKPVKRKGPF